MENYIIESKSERLDRRIAKFRRDKEHFQYLINKGFHQLDIASRLIHNMLFSMRIGLENKYPDVSSDEIHEKMKKIMENDMKIKKLKRRKPNDRN